MTAPLKPEESHMNTAVKPENVPGSEAEAHKFDIHVGRQITYARRIRNVSMEQLAAHLDLTFQQIQKYSNGKNRVSAGRLMQIANYLRQPIEFFFPDPQTDLDDAPDLVQQMLTLPGGVEVARAFQALPGDARGLVVDLASRLVPPAPATNGKANGHG